MGILKRGGKAPVSSTRSWCSFQAITQKYRLYVSMHIKITAELQGQTVPCMGRRDLLHIPRHLPSDQETASTTNQPWELHCQSHHRASRNTYLCYSIEEHAEPRNWTSVPKHQPIRMYVWGVIKSNITFLKCQNPQIGPLCW